MITINSLQKQRAVLKKKGLCANQIIDYYKDWLAKLNKKIEAEEKKLTPCLSELDELRSKRFVVFCFYNALVNEEEEEKAEAV